MPATFVPIWSFDYLQGVARYLAQQAVQTERDFVRFLDRAEKESLTLLQLQQGKEIASAERMLAVEQREAAEAEVAVYNRGAELASLRQSNARDDRDDFEEMTHDRIEYDIKVNAAIYGDDSSVTYLTQWRDLRVLEYELASRNRQIEQLGKAREVAQAQAKSAAAQLDVAEQMEVVAGLNYKASSEQLAAFSHQFFTPDVWREMAAFMRSITRSYLRMATRAARMMQQAYNFEFDQNRRVIRSDYVALGVKGLLGAGQLLLDVDSFTVNLLNVVRRKEIPVKQSISLAASYPFHFESQFRQTGRMEFETRLSDFDVDYPGTYSRRLNRVEVEIDGIVPEGGIHGTLTNSGISIYRTAGNQLKFRIQSRETLLLSEYRIRHDSLVFPSDGKTLALFEGAGVASTWALEIPMSSNDLDYEAITDLRLVFYYTAFFDPILEEQVKAELAATPGAFARAREFPLRFTYPDSFYHFLDTGVLAFDLEAKDFPAHQTQPTIRHLAVKVATTGQADPSGWTVHLAVPGHPDPVPAVLDQHGLASAGPQHPWGALAQGGATGEYRIELRLAGNPGPGGNGGLRLAEVDDVLLLLEYDYVPQGS